MDNIKDILEEALKTLPYKQKYADLRFHLNKAIFEIERIDKKDRKINEQKTPQPQWKFEPSTGTLKSPFQQTQKELKLKLRMIDDLISSEKNKLEEMTKKKPTIQKPSNDSDMFTD